MATVFIIIILTFIVLIIDKNKKTKIEKEFLAAIGVTNINGVTKIDSFVTVKSRSALESYDDIKFFKENKDKLTTAKRVIEYKSSLKKNIEEFLKNNNYTKEEVMSGFKQLLMQSGYTDLLCLVKDEE